MRRISYPRLKVGDKIERFLKRKDITLPEITEEGLVTDIQPRLATIMFPSGEKVFVLNKTGRFAKNSRIRVASEVFSLGTDHIGPGDIVERLLDGNPSGIGPVSMVGPGYAIVDFTDQRIKIALTQFGHVNKRIKSEGFSFCLKQKIKVRLANGEET